MILAACSRSALLHAVMSKGPYGKPQSSLKPYSLIMLLKSMRQANKAFEAEGLMNSQTTEFYRDMHDSQMASDLAQKGALGLADLSGAAVRSASCRRAA